MGISAPKCANVGRFVVTIGRGSKFCVWEALDSVCLNTNDSPRSEGVS